MVVALAIGLSGGWVGAASKNGATDATVALVQKRQDNQSRAIHTLRAADDAVSSQLARLEAQMEAQIKLLEGIREHQKQQQDNIKEFYAKYGMVLDKGRQDMLEGKY